MPIRFLCDRCGQHLSIARRKAGTEIDCPRCGLSQAVPGEPATVERVVDEPIAMDPVADEPSERVEEATHEEGPPETESDTAEAGPPFGWEPSETQPPPIPKEINLSDTIDLTYPLDIPPIAGAPSPPLPPVPSQGDDRPSETAPRLPIPWSIYTQVLLLLIVAGGAFSAGYYLGRQDGLVRDANAPRTEREVAVDPGDGFAEEEVLLEVRLLWTPNFNQSSGDQGAVFVALPEKSVPASALPITGLRPQSPDSPESRASIAAVRSAGGAFSRAESDGTAAAVLPREGHYHLLMISRNVLRPDDQPIRAHDLVGMKQYFAEPEELIGRNKYVWLAKEIRVGTPAVEHNFGFDGL